MPARRPRVRRVVKLSVIVPFYNVQSYAPETLRSLRANAREDFEFILVDDVSTDETPEILRACRTGTSGGARVCVRHERNGGLATARNTGLDAGARRIRHLPGRRRLAGARLLRASWSPVSSGWAATSSAPTTCSARRRARTVARVPHGRRGVVIDPREAILPAGRTTSVDYAYAWAGIYHRRLLDDGLLHFRHGLRTAEDRPWIWRLHREARVVRRRGAAGRLLPARGGLVADPDRRRAAARLHPRLRPGDRGDGRGQGRRACCCRRRCAPTARSSPTI